MMHLMLSLLACASHHVAPEVGVAPPAPVSTVVPRPLPQPETGLGPVEVEAVARVEPRGDDVAFGTSTETLKVSVALSGIPEGAHQVEVRKGSGCGFSSAATAAVGPVDSGAEETVPVGAERTEGTATLDTSGLNTAALNNPGKATMASEETADLAAATTIPAGSSPETAEVPASIEAMGGSAEESRLAAGVDVDIDEKAWSGDMAMVQVDRAGKGYVDLSIDPSALRTGAVVVVDGGTACGVVASAK